MDTPGHASTLVQLHLELDTGRNQFEFELPPGHKRPAGCGSTLGYPATFELIENVLTGVASIFPSPYIHIGGDEAWGMPHDLYSSYVCRVREFVRSIGKRPLGWQDRHAPARSRRHHPVLVHRYRPCGIVATRGSGTDGHAPGHVSQGRRDGGGRVGARDRVTLEPLLPGCSLR